MRVRAFSLMQRPWHSITTTKLLLRQQNTVQSALIRRHTTSNLARRDVLTLLHKTAQLLPRVLPPENDNRLVQSLPFWDRLIADTQHDLQSPATRSVRVVVYGLDRWAKAEDIITALLTDPLASGTWVTSLNNRWSTRSHEPSLTLEYGAVAKEEKEGLKLPCPYLRQFSAPLQITEIATPQLRSQQHSISPSTVSAIFNADIPIIVCNPLTTPLNSLSFHHLPLSNPNFILVLTTNPLSSQNDGPNPLPLPLQNTHVLFINPTQAVNALTDFSANPTSPQVIGRYQRDFVSSGVSQVTRTLGAALSSPQSTSVTSPLGSRVALSRIEGALSTCQDIVRKTRDEVTSLRSDISDLSAETEAVCEASKTILESYPGGTPALKNGIITGALESAEKDMRGLMNNLSWWKMILSIDELSDILRDTTERTWCKNLETQLNFQSGRLHVLQSKSTRDTFDLLKRQAAPPFNSPLLLNSLLQLKYSPSYLVTPQSLTSPITTRREQIIHNLIPSLHRTAQRVTVAVGTGVATGSGIGWLGWLGWLSGAGDSLGFVGIDSTTAVGIGVLTAVACIRWGVETWERSKKRWWVNWFRVGEGLERDLHVTLDRVVREQVLLVANAGSEGLQALIQKRESELGIIEEEIQQLQKESASCAQKPESG